MTTPIWKDIPYAVVDLADTDRITGTMPVSNGGTGSATALNNNRVLKSSSGTIVEAAAITGTRVLVSDASGIPIAGNALTQNRVVVGDASGLPTPAAAITASRVLTSDSNGVPTHSVATAAQLLSMPVWTKYTVTYTDLATAGTTNDITLFSLPAKSLIHRVIVKHTTAFSGSTIISYTLSVGIVGTLAKYIAAFDVFQATGNAVFGVAATTVNATLEDFSATTAIRVAAIAAGANLNAATAGAADVYVQTSLLP